MAFGNGPRIVTDGLVLSLDAADRNSYVSGSTTWSDLTGNTNGTLLGTIGYNNSAGGSLVFDGSSSYCLAPGIKSFSVPATVSITCLRANVPNNYLLFWDALTGAGGGRQQRIFDTSILFVDTLSSQSFAPVSQMNVYSWTNTTYTITQTTANVYVNGNLIVSNLATTYPMNTGSFGSNLYIGRVDSGASSFYFSGSVSNVGIYNRVLSAQEVLQNYNALKSRFGL